MATFLDLKTYVANQLGADNASTPVPKRDKIINQARREFYSSHRWGFLEKTATVSLTNGEGSLPADYNRKFAPVDVYTYLDKVKFQYTRVEFGDVGYYTDAEYVYAVDLLNGVIKTNQNVPEFEVEYVHLPADVAIDGTGDNDVEPVEDITPIGLLAIAKWWLSSERATGKYQLFQDQYKEELLRYIAIDASTKAVRPLRPRRRMLRTGYWGRR